MTKSTTFCDNCGKEIKEIPLEDNLLVTMKVGHLSDSHYCFACGERLLSVWWAEAKKMQEEMKAV